MAFDPWKAALAEYESIRQESHQSREAQQSILSWSLAGFAVIFAGTLAGDREGATLWLRIVIFGLGLPGLALGACLTWAGELLRMERAGFYLRGRERTFWSTVSTSTKIREKEVLRPAELPLLWENFIWSGQERKLGGKHVLAYVGPALLFGGVFMTSLLMLNVEIWTHAFLSGVAGAIWKSLSLLWTLLISSSSLLVVSAQAGRILSIGREAAGLRLSQPDRAPRLLRWLASVAERIFSRIGPRDR